MWKVLAIVLISFSADGKSLLIIGDSHTAGIFGKELHHKMTDHFKQVVTLGHASSAPIHWIDDKSYRLSGGVFNQLFLNGKTYKNPRPTDWREKVLVPKIKRVLKDNAYHQSWKQPNALKADVIIIALGANDARAIADENGHPRPWTLSQRAQAIQKMLDLIADKQCIWIGPPNGIKKPQANQEFLYEYLADQVQNRCTFFSSNHFKVTTCDGIHFNCAAGKEKALEWVSEVESFILRNI